MFVPSLSWEIDRFQWGKRPFFTPAARRLVDIQIHRRRKASRGVLTPFLFIQFPYHACPRPVLVNLYIVPTFKQEAKRKKIDSNHHLLNSVRLLT